MLNLANDAYQPRVTEIVSNLTGEEFAGEAHPHLHQSDTAIHNRSQPTQYSTYSTNDQTSYQARYPLRQPRLKLQTGSRPRSAPQGIHHSAFSGYKRLIDVAGAVLGLTVLGVLLVPISIAIRLDSPGPIFYSQVRCGLKGKPFRIWKFRSMVYQAEHLQHLVSNQAKGGIFKNKHDPRVTRVGRFLRKTSLDEFPQFWNVLRGEMSLVGTRPPTVSEVLTYKPHHWDRLRVKPGITGEWQANGRSSVEDFEDVVKMDLDYQRKWSVLYDLRLIWKTIQVVFTGHGAY